MSVYYLGNDVDIELTVRDDNTLELADATTIVLTITKPDGTTVTPAVTHVSLGQYRVVYQPDVVGHFAYSWTTTGPTGVVPGSFEVVSGQKYLSTTTLKDIVDEVLTILYGVAGNSEQLTWLTSDITTSDTTLNVADASQVSRGVIEVGDELMWVASTDRQQNTVTVAPFGRGYRQTDAAAHSTNDMIVAAPEFPRSTVKRAVSECMAGLFPQLFAVLTDESNTSNPVQVTYGLPSSVAWVLGVQWQAIGPSQTWVRARRWRLDTSADSTAFPSGKSIDIYDGMSPGRTIKVTYAAEPTPLRDDTDTLGDAGLSDGVRDVIVYGAVARLLTMFESARLATARVEQSNRGQLVQPGSATNASKYFMQLYLSRLADEADALRTLHPTPTHLTR